MPSREYEVQADDVLPEGFWPGMPLEAGDRSELERLMLDAATVLDRIGGTFSIVAIRQELIDEQGHPTGLYAPVGFRAKWESYAPGRRAPRPEPVAETPESEPEPENFPEPEVGDPSMNGEAPPVEEWGPDAEAALAEA